MPSNSWDSIQNRANLVDRCFARCIEDVEATQRRFLQILLRRNAASAFGRDFGFASITSAEDFRSRIPIGSYPDFEPFIQRCLDGETGVLTAQGIRFAERTGGSSGSQKVIPYTTSALEGFQRALWPWIADLLRKRPKLKEGTAYFAMSPVGRTGRERIGKLPLGSPTNFAYFGPLRNDLEQITTLPSDIRFMTDFNLWQRRTCVGLLADERLSLVWVWSPTFFSELLRSIGTNSHLLIADLENELERKFADDKAYIASRVRTVAEALNRGPPDWASIWPKLDTISCWTDASSRFFADELQQAFPRVFIQPKGLMSTEAAVSFPYGRQEGAILAVLSGFFEFAGSNETFFAWELKEGESYRVIATTASGLYRYDTGDVVTVTGHEQNAPLIRFMSRAGAFSDLCGEKLTEEFVVSALAKAGLDKSIYAVVVPVAATNPHYEIHLDIATLSAEERTRLAREIDAAFGANPQYDYARRIGQLRPVEIQCVPNLYGHIKRFRLSGGSSLAGLKPPTLLGPQQRDLISALRGLQ